MACFRAEMERAAVAERAELRRIAVTDEPLAHLLAVLDHCGGHLREIGSEGDAAGIESHRAQLVAGREWPGEPIIDPGSKRHRSAEDK